MVQGYYQETYEEPDAELMSGNCREKTKREKKKIKEGYSNKKIIGNYRIPQVYSSRPEQNEDESTTVYSWGVGGSTLHFSRIVFCCCLYV